MVAGTRAGALAPALAFRPIRFSPRARQIRTTRAQGAATELRVEPGNAASINIATAAGYNAAGIVKDRPFGKEQELNMLRYVLSG